MNLSQLGAMAHYEVLMQWRRRSLLGVMLGLFAVPIVAFLAFGQNDVGEIQRTWTAAGGLPTEAVSAIITRYVVLYSSMSLYIVALLMLPVLAADVVPADKQTGVRELIDSLPMSSGTYLFGKLLGYWLSLIIGGVAVMIALGLTLRVLMGPFEAGPYLFMWLAMLGGIAVINGGLSLLLASAQPTRRRAISIGVAFAVICLFANVSGMTHYKALLDYLNPGRSAIVSYFLFTALSIPTMLGNALGNLIEVQDVYRSMLAGVAEVAIVWLGMWWWFKRARD